MSSATDRGTSVMSAGDANIVMNQKRNVVVHCLHHNADASGNICANVSGRSNVLFKAANNHSIQLFNKNTSGFGNTLAITGVTYSLTGVATVMREYDGKKGDSGNLLVLGTGQGNFDYAGYAIECGNANVKVNFASTTEGFVTLELSKGESFVDPDTQRLQAYQRGSF
jgi:hypothetical protein